MWDLERRYRTAHRDDEIKEVWTAITHICSPVTELAVFLRQIILEACDGGCTRDRIGA